MIGLSIAGIKPKRGF